MDLPSHVRVAVVGSGFAGLGTAVALLQEGVRRLRRPRAGRQRRRHLARQHLPGLRLRRPEPPLLLLVRAEPRLVARLRPPARDPRLPRAGRRRLRRPPVPARLDRPRRPASGTTRRCVWRLETSRGPLTADVVVSGCGGLVEPALPGRPRASRRSTGRPSTPPAGTTRRPDRQAGRRRRHRRLGDPVRAGDPAGASATSRCSSGRRRGSCRASTAPSATGRTALFRRVPAAAEGRPHRAATGCASSTCSRSRASAALNALAETQAGEAPRGAGARPGAARPAHPRLRVRLQAGARLQRLLPGADAAQRRPS